MTAERISDRLLRARLAEDAYTELLLNGRGLQVDEPGANCSRFYYRPTTTDTVWHDIPLRYELLPCGGSGCGFEVRTFEWDGRPPLALWVTLSGRDTAPSTSVRCTAVEIVSVARDEPRALLEVITEHALTCNGELRGYAFEPAEQYQRSGCRIAQRGREMVLGPIRTQGNYEPEEGAPRMQLPAGRYQYQRGRVVRLRP